MTREEFLSDLKAGRKDFRGENLRGANLSRLDLRRVCLSKADLGEASLYAANLSRSDLREANLTRTNLEVTDLYKADLRGARLEGARLWGAALDGAILQDDTDLHGKESVTGKATITMTEQEKALAILMGVADDLYDTHEVEAGCWARQIEEAIRLLKAQQPAKDQEEG